MGEDGQGAEEWAAALEAAESSPLAADDSLEPFVIGLPNLEGDAGGTFPDVGEGAQAAVKFINEKLGGIGADLEAGTPGRPVELVYCPHVIDQNEAQACANEVADANPNVVMVGVDFFTPLMYPLFANFPVIETLPIFIADFDQPGVVSPFGGCPTAFPSSAQMIAEIKEHDRLAVIWDQNAPGEECWQRHPGALLPVLRRHDGELRVPGLPVRRPVRRPASRGRPAGLRLPRRSGEPGRVLRHLGG